VEVISGPPTPVLDAAIRVTRLAGLDLYNPADPFRMPTLAELANPLNLLEWLSVCTMGFPEPFIFGLRAYTHLRRRLPRIDVLHDNQCLAYGIWALARQAPLVATIHHPITMDRDIAVRAAGTTLRRLQELRWYSFIGMQRRVARRMRHIITVSSAARDDLVRAFGISPRRCRIVPNGIDTDRFRPLNDIAREAGRVMVTNSADVPLKGLSYLLEAVAELRRRHPVKLVVVGTPKKNGHIQRRIRELGIGPLVTFTGRLEERALVEQYARAEVAVVPSVYEGFGLPAGEAMACAVPVVSTSGGALPEVVGDSGVLVPPGDAAALARAIADLLAHPQRSRQLGESGRRRVLQHFSWERAAQSTVAVYREAWNDHRRLPAPDA
jgi:glycosyltransferase involved in cell wall biosynthesis